MEAGTLTRLKTCVYAVSLNEIKHVDNFMAGCAGADLVLICDTGSTDGTAERLRELGAVVYDITVKPWRFDDARNTALSLIPADMDYCLSIDMDEYLQPGWVEALNTGVANAGRLVHRVGYTYVWNFNPDGTPVKVFIANKIHHRLAYRWRHPCHETLYYEGDAGPEFQIICEDLNLHHHPDFSKSRGQYLPLLKIATDEEPRNDIMRLWYARELMFHGQPELAIQHFHVHLDITDGSHTEERAMSMRFISRCLAVQGDHAGSIMWAHKATQEWPHTRETWMDLARSTQHQQDWMTTYYACRKALAITWHNNNYIGEPANWGVEPVDLAAISAFYSGHHAQSLDYALQALAMDTGNQRLQNNVILVASSASSGVKLINVNAANLADVTLEETDRKMLMIADHSIDKDLTQDLADTLGPLGYEILSVNSKNWLITKK
jgi:hypothetical protein